MKRLQNQSDSERIVSLSEVLLSAALVWLAAWLRVEFSLWALAFCLAAICYWLDQFWLMLLLLLLAVGGRSAMLHDSYQSATSESFDGELVVLDDVVWNTFGGVSFTAKLKTNEDSFKVSGYASGIDASRIAEAKVGSTIQVAGMVTGVEDNSWNRFNRIEGRLAVKTVGAVAGPSFLRSVPERVRFAVFEVARHLPESSQPLFTGLVVGEDSTQSALERSEFRVAGMSHLLAVSGQNVALLLTVLRWPASFLPLWCRNMMLTGVVIVFALATRLEPSVLRASTVAVIGIWGTYSGARNAGLRNLLLAVIALVAIDPVIVSSIGFQLSVLASAGILITGEWLIERLHRIGFPKVIAEALAITCSAQLFVSPLLIARFGDLSLAQIPANVVAGPIAGFVMTFGAALAMLELVVPSVVMHLLVLPIHWSVVCLQGIASWAAYSGFPGIGFSHLTVLAVMLVAARLVGVRALIVSCIIAIPLLGIGKEAERCVGTESYSIYQTAGPSILVLGQKPLASGLDSFISQCASENFGLVIASNGRHSASKIVNSFRKAAGNPVLLASSLHSIPGAERLVQDMEIDTSAGVLLVEVSAHELRVTIN